MLVFCVGQILGKWLALTDPTGLKVRHCGLVPVPADDDDDLHVR